MGARCTLSLDEGKTLLERTPDISDEQDEELARLFPHYLFFAPEPRGRKLSCSGCNESWFEPYLVMLDTPEHREAMYGKHDDLGRCPRCGRVVRLKNEGITKSGVRLFCRKPVLFLIADGTEGGLWGRFCLASKTYQETRTPIIALIEKARFYWKTPDAEHPKGCVAEWINNGRYWEQRIAVEEWRQTKECNEPWAYEFGTYYNRSQEDYSVIGWDELEKSGLRYNGYRTLFGNEKAVMEGNARNHGLCGWLGYYASGMPQLEFVAKMGLSGFARELIDDGVKNCALLDWKQSRPDRFLRLRPETARAVLQDGLRDPRELRTAQQMDKKKMKPEEIAALMRFADSDAMQVIIEVAGMCGCGVSRLCRYIVSQSTDWKGREEERTRACANGYCDYVREAKLLEYDLRQQQVAMPPRLSDAHILSANTVRNLSDDVLDEKYRNTLLPRLRKRYEWNDGTHCIVVPSGMKAIIAEGQRLSHCVGGYAERHVVGNTVILFLRRCDDKTQSLCTIEMEKDGVEIRQIHGYRNEFGGGEPPRKTYRAFLEEWTEWMKSGSQRLKDGRPKKAKKKKEEISA